jgi:hypothetical protein
MTSLPRHFGLRIALIAGVVLAIVLCVQCVRTYSYVGRVLVPEQAESEADRQAGNLVTAVRSAPVADVSELSPVMTRVLEANSQRVLWMRLLDSESVIRAQAGSPIGKPEVPQRWWQIAEKHEDMRRYIDAPEGKAWVVLIPFRLPRPPRGEGETPTQGEGRGRGNVAGQGRRNGAYLLEVAVRLEAISGDFHELSQNLVFGVCASIALLASMIVMGLRAPVYLRGNYLEREMQLARRVQSDLLPKAASISPCIDFAASAVAADHVGGDFYDLFETDSGKVAIVLGDVSGKGIPAALLASVVQGAIRSSTAARHETACERINTMLCERSASGQYATLFWAIFDPLSATLRYVNAGHGEPLVLKKKQGTTQRLSGGCPVLGLLPKATYSANSVQIEAGDTLVVYSDGISEAANAKQEEFGDDRVFEIGKASASSAPADICGEIMRQVAAFSGAGSAPDDRTLLVIRFLQSSAALTA